MTRVSINFADVEGGFEAIPEGTYMCEIEKVECRESKSSEHDYLNWEFKIVDDDDHEGQHLWMITSLSPRALFRLKDVFESLEVLEDEMNLDFDDDVDITPTAGPRMLEPDVEGLQCMVIVKNELYEGKERNRVEEIRPAAAKAATKRNGRAGTRSRSSSKSTRRALR
jgi:hypothetical protein